MPYSRPTLSQLIQQARQDLNSSGLAGVDGFLRRGVLPQLATAQAGFAYEHYGYLDWIALQAVPYTATGEYLEGWGALVGIYRKAATAAVGTVMLTGAPGITIPAGSTLTGASGAAYTTTADATVGPVGGVNVSITASQAGSASTPTIGAALSLTSPITGVNAAGTVVAGATDAPGTDQETDADFRTRVLQRYSQPPQGGAKSDYLEWTLAVPGVTRAWCNPNGYGPGTVVVYPMLDGAEAAHSGFPQGSDGVATGETRDTAATGDQLIVANALYPLQPVTALVYVCAPKPAPLGFTIANLSAATAATKAGIAAALADVLVRLGDPVGGTLYPSDFEAAISSVAGVTRFTLQSPSAPVTVGIGNLPTVGVITYA